MKTRDDSAYARQRLQELGVPEAITQRMRLLRDEDQSHDGQHRSTLEFTYKRAKNGFEREAACASINCTNDDLETLLHDRERIATFIDMGMGASPAGQRLELPEWILKESSGAEQRRLMQKVSGIALQAIPEKDS